jgi:adenine-specific DNA-methyltransferase
MFNWYNTCMNQLQRTAQTGQIELTKLVDARRIAANRKLDSKQKSAQGQFMTPRPVAQFMASLFRPQAVDEVRLLDAGAGVGSLTAAFVEEFCNRQNHVKDHMRRIAVTAYEVDPMLAKELQATFADCAQVCQREEITFEPTLVQRDFIEDIGSPLFMGVEAYGIFTHAILNPPYKKINSTSGHRLRLRSLGIETSNLYTGFLAIAIRLLEPGGELVAITPRSFCNGPYFKPFRQLLLDQMALRHIHIFESRTDTFSEDEVLQENIIFHAVKDHRQESVIISVSKAADLADRSSRIVDFPQIVKPDDPEQFIHISAHEAEQQVSGRMSRLPCTLEDLGIEASTGPVVDFRLKEHLRSTPEPGAVPLIYPIHCKGGFVVWPVLDCRKPNAIVNAEPVQKWLYPNGHYTLVRRFSSKEERRRVMATVYDLSDVPGEKVGFENHINVFHRKRQGLAPEQARGLAVYLNSTFYDVCFRQFNGHTQVNVKDLYNLRYPDLATLERWGRRVTTHTFPPQEVIDAWIDEELL